MQSKRSEALKWAETRVKELQASRKKHKKNYFVITSMMALVNIAIVTMASIGLSILIRYSENGDESSNTAIIMASVAASLTILIFFVNIVNVVYRSSMRWQTYRNAADSIQHEVIRFSLNSEMSEDTKAKEKFEKRISEIYEEAHNFKREKKAVKILLNALSGGDNV